MEILLLCIQLLSIPAFSPLCIGCIRKVKAKLQNRQGASVFQPYADLWKLFHKDEIISSHASWIFRIAPFLIFTITLVIAASIPVAGLSNTLAPAGDFLVVVYLLALSSFILALAGMDAASAFGGFGSSREMTVASLAEGGFVLSLLTAAILSKTTSLAGMTAALSTLPITAWLPLGAAFIAFFIIMIAETGRVPIDNPATHLELTMIHEAMILEYSGKRLALIEWASANKLLIFAVLGTSVFIPLGNTAPTTLGDFVINVTIMIVKILAVLVSVAFLESMIAKLRLFKIPDLLVMSFVLGILGIVVSAL